MCSRFVHEVCVTGEVGVDGGVGRRGGRGGEVSFTEGGLVVGCCGGSSHCESGAGGEERDPGVKARGLHGGLVFMNA